MTNANIVSSSCNNCIVRTLSRNGLNEWINFIIYIPPIKNRGSNPGVYSPAVDDVYSVRRWQPGRNVKKNFSSRRVRTRSILAQVLTGDCCRLLQRAIHGVYIAHVYIGRIRHVGHYSYGCVMRWGGRMLRPYLYCLCLTSRESLSTRAPVQLMPTVNQRRT